MHAFIRDGRVYDNRGRPTIHTVAMDEEPEGRIDAAEAFEQFKRLLSRLDDPGEMDRFLKLCQDYGYSAAESDEPTTAGGGTVNPYAEAQDRRRRLAHDAALSSAERAFAQRFPSARRISTIW